MTINPGDTTIERGSGLVVLADFHSRPPGEATLVIQPLNQPAQRIPLVKNLDDPVFGGGLPEVDTDLTYHVEYSGQSTRDYAVKIFEHPRLDRADATLRYPDYTKLPDKKVPDTHRVSAVEGTKLDVAFQLNKPVKSATLVAKDGSKVELAVSADKPVAELRDFPFKTSQTYEVKLVDVNGRANKLPAQFIVEALPNRRPGVETHYSERRSAPLPHSRKSPFKPRSGTISASPTTGSPSTSPAQGEKVIELGHDTPCRREERGDLSFEVGRTGREAG
ncbi:hypothetical protein CfE428DRAFT_0779 [Chthoniobacter flavus Ellin428]|uniref:Uncharacterized protein n=1 Tax=Chthoniobacter flavus Ellin428 TaxID=497964 RepID=B4CVU2_9BACT|nr:hypothetical protein [Chthoniobacter flavus]EDY21534.1 hypothetical protein CfE428DRAFT_0779 [Chthoniobacter flavus Ellin428]